MANSLEFSRHGDPIEGRYDAYGEFLADSLPEDPETTRENQDRITRKIDEAPVLHSSEIEPYDPFSTEIDEDDPSDVRERDRRDREERE